MCFRGAYLYRRERTKRRHEPSGTDELDNELSRHADPGGDDLVTSDSASSCPEGSLDDEALIGEAEQTPAEEGDNDVDDDKVPLQLSDTMKRLLEMDYDLIKNKNKVCSMRNRIMTSIAFY